MAGTVQTDHPVERELVQVAQIEPESGETRARFLKRLTRAIHRLPDPEWDLLSEEGQIWTNASVEAMNQKQDPPDIEEYFMDTQEDETPSEHMVEEAADDLTEEEIPETEEDLQEIIGSVEESEESPTVEPVEGEHRERETTPSTAPFDSAGWSGIEPPRADPQQKRGAGFRVREIVLDHPDISRDAIVDQLAKEGLSYSKSTAENVRHDMRQTVAVLRARGLISW